MLALPRYVEFEDSKRIKTTLNLQCVVLIVRVDSQMHITLTTGDKVIVSLAVGEKLVKQLYGMQQFNLDLFVEMKVALQRGRS